MATLRNFGGYRYAVTGSTVFSRGTGFGIHRRSSDGLHCCVSTRFIPLDGLLSNMSLEETVDYLAEELDLERSEHVREVGQSVAELRD